MQRETTVKQRRTNSRSRSPAVRRGGTPSRTSRSSGSKRASSSMNPLVRIYLVAFNALSAAAWLYFAYCLWRNWPACTCTSCGSSLLGCLSQCGKGLRSMSLARLKDIFYLGGLPSKTASVRAAFSSTIGVLAWVQGLAIFEVLHAALGLVPSPVLTTAVQVASRLLVTLLLGVRLQAGAHWGYLIMAAAWTLADVTRYIYYVMHLCRGVPMPRLLLWLRYSLYLVLYPLGTVGEMSLMRAASVALAGSPWQYAVLALLAIYPLGFAYMYLHMGRQRSKYLK